MIGGVKERKVIKNKLNEISRFLAFYFPEVWRFFYFLKKRILRKRTISRKKEYSNILKNVKMFLSLNKEKRKEKEGRLIKERKGVEFPVFFSFFGWQPDKNKKARSKRQKAKGEIILPLYFGWGLKLALVKLRNDALNPTSKIFKRYWQEAVALILLISLVAFNFFWYQPKQVLGATYTWQQTNWSGGATTTSAVHPTNQTGWTYYSLASTTLSIGADLKLATTSASITQTTDSDFNAGSFYRTTISGSGAGASIELSRHCQNLECFYFSNGNFTSSIIDTGQNSIFNTLNWTASTSPPITTIKFQLRSDNSTTTLATKDFLGPDGATTTYYTTSGTQIWSGHNGHRYIQYKAYLETTDSLETPALDDVTINYQYYLAEGTLISSPYDTIDPANVLAGIKWTESLPSASTTIDFQVRTSPNGSTWSSWCGPNDADSSTTTCNTTSWFTDPTGGEAMDEMFTDGQNDRWIQYRVKLSITDTSVTPTLFDVTITYTANDPPEFNPNYPTVGAGGVGVNVASSTQVEISFSVRDPDTDSGSPTNQWKVKLENLEYSLNGGTSWNPISTTTIFAGANIGNIINLGPATSTYVATTTFWNAKTQIPGVYTSQLKTRVTVNDREAFNNLASQISATATLDTKDPVAGTPPGGGTGININQNATTTLGNDKTSTTSVTVYLSATDNSSLQMRIYETGGQDSGWIGYASNYPFTLTSGDGTKTVYVRFRDSFGNEVGAYSDTIVLDTTPPTAFSPFIQDVSNTETSEWRIFWNWGKAEESDFFKYQVYQSTSSDPATFSLLQEITDINLNYFLDQGLTQGVTYYYYTKYLDDLGNSSQTQILFQEADAQPSDIAPPAISNLATSSLTASSIKINWQTDEPASTLVLYSTDLSFNNLQGVAGYATSHAVTLVGLAANTTYNYKVKSCDGSNNCSESSPAQFTTLAGDTTPPSIISGPTVSDITYNSAKISWQTDEASDSFVEFSTTSGFTIGTMIGQKEATTSHIVNLSNLTASTTYYYKVRSEDSAGNEVISAQFSFTTLAAPEVGDVTPPTISNVTSTAIAYNTATIQWQTNEPSSSFVEFGPSASYGRIYGQDDSTISHSVQLPKNLTPNSLYHFRVRSADGAGNEAISSDYTFTTAPDPADNVAPVISAINIWEPTQTSVTISWQTNEDADSYIDYSTDKSYSASQGSPVMTTAHSFTLVGLNPATQYFFRVRSADPSKNQAIDDNSGQGYTFSTAQGPTPPVISNVQIVEVTSNSAKIQWQTDISANSFVEYGLDTSYGKITGQNDSATSHSVVLTGLLSKATYHFRVRSTAQTEAVSQDFTFTTESASDITPPIISDIQAINITLTEATITWTTNEPADSIVKYGTTTDYQWVAGTTATSTTSHIVQLTGLSPGTNYHYQVVSKDSSGNISQSSDNTFTTLPDTTPPTISNIQAPVVDRNSTTITWDTDEPATSKVEYSTSSNLSNSTTTSEITDPRTQHSVIISNLLSETTYYYRAISQDSSGNIATSPISSFTTKSAKEDFTSPTISNVALSSITLNSAIIIWTTNEPSNSIVDYGTTDSLGLLAGQPEESTTSHSVALTNLSASTTYYFQVRSQDSAGNTATDNNSGNYYTFTTLKDTTPPIISGVTVSVVSDTKTTIIWQTNELATSQVVYGTSLAYGSEIEDTTLAIKHSMTLAELTKETIYYFKVISRDPSGNETIDDNNGQSYTFTTTKEPGETIFIGGGGIPPGYKSEKEWCEKMGLYWHDNTCHKETKVEIPPEKKVEVPTEIKAMEEKIEKEVGVAELIKKASQAFITKIWEALPQNPFLKEVSEERFVASVTEIAPKVVSAPIIGGEYPQIEVGADYAKFVWLTDKKSNSIVALTEAKDYDPTKDEPYTWEVGKSDDLVTYHQVYVNGLKPDTLYHYEVRSKAQLGDWAKSGDRTFKTLSRLPEISEVKFLEITENSAKISWKTTLPTKAKIEILDVKTGEKMIKEDPSYLREHLLTIERLKIATSYSLQVFAEDEQRNVSFSSILPFSTTISLKPPVISQVRVTTSLIPGAVIRVQAIISWKTDKPATSRVYYEEGVSPKKELALATPPDLNLVLDHIIITTAFKPGKIYRFRVESIDAFDNKSYSKDFTILTPRPRESVLDLIIQNFEQTFEFLKRIRF